VPNLVENLRDIEEGRAVSTYFHTVVYSFNNSVYLFYGWMFISETKLVIGNQSMFLHDYGKYEYGCIWIYLYTISILYTILYLYTILFLRLITLRINLFIIDLIVIIEWLVFRVSSLMIEIYILVDWISRLFIGLVLIITSIVVLYRIYKRR